MAAVSFAAPFAAPLHDVPASVAHLVPMEVGMAFRMPAEVVALPFISLAAVRIRAVVVFPVVVVIHPAVKFAAAVVPGSRANEDPAVEPLRTVIPIGRAVIRRIRVIAIRTYRGRPDLHGNLCCTRARRRRQQECRGQSSE
jgi:hypothetical protein